ncbi:hypothetical protein FACS189429_8740 [Bacteroidia bacterium]|nr:hypothetical protein FACS189429_8740 [Bacteroidia bacterium]
MIVLPVVEQQTENEYAAKLFLNGNADTGSIYNMENAANLLYGDYTDNKELTAFTALDYENFYETK